MSKKDLKIIFSILEGVLMNQLKGLHPTKIIIGNKAKTVKRGLHLYGKKEVSIMGRKAQPTYLCGIIQQKHFVSLYFMPMYSHPKSYKLSPALAQMKKGRSCLNITKLDPALIKEVRNLIRDGIARYKDEGWV